MLVPAVPLLAEVTLPLASIVIVGLVKVPAEDTVASVGLGYVPLRSPPALPPGGNVDGFPVILSHDAEEDCG
jgi:hypothetical protein